MKKLAVALERLLRVVAFILIVWIPGSHPLKQSHWARDWEREV